MSRKRARNLVCQHTVVHGEFADGDGGQPGRSVQSEAWEQEGQDRQDGEAVEGRVAGGRHEGGY